MGMPALTRRRRKRAPLLLILLLSTSLALTSAGCGMAQELELVAEVERNLPESLRSRIKDIEWTILGKGRNSIWVFTKLSSSLHDSDTVVGTFSIAKAVYQARGRVRSAPTGHTQIHILSSSKKELLSLGTEHKWLWQEIEDGQHWAAVLKSDVGSWISNQPNPRGLGLTGTFVYPCHLLKDWPYEGGKNWGGYVFVNAALRAYLRSTSALESLDEFVDDVSTKRAGPKQAVVFLVPTPGSGTAAGSTSFHNIHYNFGGY